MIETHTICGSWREDHCRIEALRLTIETLSHVSAPWRSVENVALEGKPIFKFSNTPSI